MEESNGFYPGMRGGSKAKWLKEHSSLVLSYYHTFGFEKTAKEFNLEEGTLSKLVRHGSFGDNRPALPRKDERALLQSEIAIERTRVLEKKIFQGAEGDVMVTLSFKLPETKLGLVLGSLFRSDRVDENGKE